MKDNVNSVASGGYVGPKEVSDMSWIFQRGTTALFHQDCSIAVNDFDKVMLTARMPFNVKVGELQPYYLATVNDDGVHRVFIILIVIAIRESW